MRVFINSLSLQLRIHISALSEVFHDSVAILLLILRERIPHMTLCWVEDLQIVCTCLNRELLPFLVQVGVFDACNPATSPTTTRNEVLQPRFLFTLFVLEAC